MVSFSFPLAVPAPYTPSLATKTILHITVAVILLPVIICAIIRIGGGGASNAIGQSLKSYAFLAYIALTERSSPTHPSIWLRRAHRISSTKASMVMTCIEPLAWIVTFGLSCSGAGRTKNTLGKVAAALLVVLCLCLTFIFAYSAYVYIQTHRAFKAGLADRTGRPVGSAADADIDVEVADAKVNRGRKGRGEIVEVGH